MRRSLGRAGAPVPSLQTYLRRRYDISEEQLHAIERLLHNVHEHSTHDLEAA